MEIKKLADIIEWADSWIEGIKPVLINLGEFETDKDVKQLEAVKRVVSEAIERHSVYTNALNADIVAKDAKIELMQKELDGRKAGYAALKARFDHTCKSKNDEIENLKKELDARGEEIKKLNKCIMNKNESINTANDAIVNLRKEIGAHEEENKRLSERIVELKGPKYIPIEEHSDICKTYEKRVAELEKQVKYLKKELEQTCTTKELDLKNHQKRDMALVDELAKKNDKIKDLKGTIEYYKNQERIRTDQLRATESKVEELWKEIEKFTKGEDDDHGKSGFKRYIEYLIEEEERAVPERFKERLNEEITAIFTKEEETEVNDIPCGEDAIE